MAHGTAALLGAHQSLHDATRQLHDTGLTQTLSSVRDSMNSIVPALKAFGKPFVLRAVPVADKENGTSVPPAVSSGVSDGLPTRA